MQEIGIDAERMPFDYFRRPNPVSKALAARFGRDDLIADHSHPYLYLDLETHRRGRPRSCGGGALRRRRGHEAPRRRLRHATQRPAGGSGRRAVPCRSRSRRSFDPAAFGPRAPGPGALLVHALDRRGGQDGDLPSLAAIHGSPWAYDTHVPIFFAGHRVPARTVARRVGPHDIAATLAAYLGRQAAFRIRRHPAGRGAPDALSVRPNRRDAERRPNRRAERRPP